MSIVGLSEAQVWHARAAQARRIGSMLSASDAALLESYAKECEENLCTALRKIAQQRPLPGATRTDEFHVLKQATHRHNRAA